MKEIYIIIARMRACARARIIVFYGRRGPSGKKGKYKKERMSIVFYKKWGVLANKNGGRSNKKIVAFR